jgi:hypothetical protein
MKAGESFHYTEKSEFDEFCGCQQLTSVNKAINNKNHNYNKKELECSDDQ